jgi:hypothetical protein
MTPNKATQTALTVREAALLYSVPERDLRAALAGCELPYRVDHDHTVYVDADDVAEWAGVR